MLYKRFRWYNLVAKRKEGNILNNNEQDSQIQQVKIKEREVKKERIIGLIIATINFVFTYYCGLLVIKCINQILTLDLSQEMLINRIIVIIGASLFTLLGIIICYLGLGLIFKHTRFQKLFLSIFDK